MLWRPLGGSLEGRLSSDEPAKTDILGTGCGWSVLITTIGKEAQSAEYHKRYDVSTTVWTQLHLRWRTEIVHESLPALKGMRSR